MPLIFDARGLLAPGIHKASQTEVEEALGRFQRSDRRLKLVAKLRSYLDALRRANLGASVILDGSFVMSAVDEPDDVDAILILPANWDKDADLSPMQYNLLSRRSTKREYEIEIFPAISGTERERYWLEFFAQVNVKWCQQLGWPADTRKGLVRITP